MSGTILTAQQRAVRDLACRQLIQAAETIRRLISQTADQGDREAAEDAHSNAIGAVNLLTDWYGDEPENRFQG